MIDISALRERDTAKTLTVSQLNGYIKSLLDDNKTLSAVSVSGEISNLTDHRSGHIYFSLKDSDAQIKAVMFRSHRQRLKFALSDGMKVVARGSVSLYSQGGTVQIYVTSIEPDGVGSLYLAYEQIKARLSEEGLFDEVHKQPIPTMPKKIGVITSPTGAAVRDIINVVSRRFCLADIYLYPSLVQGELAEDNLIKALDYFEESRLVDVIIIGRGGGSIEDLWAFNGERLARKIYGMSIPVISAVGHETDFTICDFVADMRAPTPSAAAEIAVPDLRDIEMRLVDFESRLSVNLLSLVERKRERLDSLKSSRVFRNPKEIFENKRDELCAIRQALNNSIDLKILDVRSKLSVISGKAEAMSPFSVLARGYSVCESDKRVVTDISLIDVGDSVRLIFSNGEAVAEIKKIKNKEVLSSEK